MARSPPPALFLLLVLFLYSVDVSGRLLPPPHPATSPALTTTAALLKAATTYSHILYINTAPLANEVTALQGGRHREHKDSAKAWTDPELDVSPSGVKEKAKAPLGGSEVPRVNYWEGEASGEGAGLLTEVHSDVDGALRTLEERSGQYSRVIVVVHGPPSFLQEAVKQAVRKAAVVPKTVWMLVSEVSVHSGSLLPSSLLTTQHNLLLVTPLPRTPQNPAPGLCVASIRRLTFVDGGLGWVQAGCGCADGSLALTADPFALPTNLGNVVLPVAIVKGSPTLTLVRTPKGPPYLDGSLGEVMRLLQQDLHFRLQVSQVKGFGNQLANGSWSGLVGVVARKEVEVGLASLSISHGRSLVVEFSDHLKEAGTYLMYPSRQLIQPVYMVFLVFSPELWGCLLGKMALLGIVLYLASSRDVTWRSHSCLFYLSAAYRSLIYQGVLEPRSSASRLTYLSCLIFALIVYVLYSGNLTAVLSLPRLQEYPKNAEEMLEQGYVPSLTKGFHQYDYFKFSPLDTFRTLFRHAEDRGTIYPFGMIGHKTALGRLTQHRVASVISSMGVVIRQNAGARPQQPCSFYVVSTPLNSGFLYLILQKNSFLSEIFNKRLRWLRDTGCLQDIYDRNHAAHCISSGRTSGNSRPLSLTVLLGAFVLWVAGILVACITFPLELLASRGKKSCWRHSE